MGNKSGPAILHVFYGILLVIMIVAKSLSSSELSFLKENITFTICASDTIEIRGIYWFINTGDDSVSTTIFYPFPLDSGAAFPHYIEVTRNGTRKAILYRQMSNGIEWRQSVAARGMDSVLVVYRQKVKKGIGQYIVSTTKLWDKALQHADFEVCIPHRMVMTFWTFQADSISTNREMIIYHSHFDSFLPDGEMDVRWR